MRKRTIRNGLRLVLTALALIIIASFYLGSVGDALSLTGEVELRSYRIGIFLAAALGSYGVVVAAFGFVLPAEKRDADARIMPVFLMIVVGMFLFFYLLAASFNTPQKPRHERLRPGEAITI